MNKPPKFKVGDWVGFVSALTGRPLPGRGRVTQIGYQSYTTKLYRIVADDSSIDLGWFSSPQVRPVADESDLP